MIWKDKNKKKCLNVFQWRRLGLQQVHRSLNVLFYVSLINFIIAIDISSPNHYQGPMPYCCFFFFFGRWQKHFPTILPLNTFFNLHFKYFIWSANASVRLFFKRLLTFRRSAIFHTFLKVLKVVFIALAATISERFTQHGGHIEEITLEEASTEPLFLRKTTDLGDFCGVQNKTCLSEHFTSFEQITMIALSF